ncbi:hypothetical protein [Actinoplanes solisilvae]|uniref:hypothetical protein n=1 Tax=Actinoplanes solisilvae TaxID=2486853 RepID=UPI00196A2C3E|nr:hypothetical protein [Actinoplanes solisilvae]
MRRSYPYVGPAELRHTPPAPGSTTVDSPAHISDDQPRTFVVTPDGRLRLAPRHSEHVALAGDENVAAAGEIVFARDETGWRVTTVTNQSTGYCPDPDCWPAVAEALDRLGIRHPGDFTEKLVFRRCESCGERNVVRDADFTCALCDADLPAYWNFAALTAGCVERTPAHVVGGLSAGFVIGGSGEGCAAS